MSSRKQLSQGASTVKRLAARGLRRLRYGPLRYVVVVTYGRTGSTLLQGVLMTDPHVIIRGEQGGTIAYLMRWYTELCGHQDRLRRDRRETSRRYPFYGIGAFSRDVARQRLRRLLLDTLLRPGHATRVVGFKEIGWPEELAECLDFLRAVLPGVRFVVNTRNLDDVVQSGFWRHQPDAAARVQALHERIMSATVGRDDVYFVSYDEWVSDPDRLRGLFKWLGLRFDRDRVDAVMRQPHSYDNRSIPGLESESSVVVPD